MSVAAGQLVMVAAQEVMVRTEVVSTVRVVSSTPVAVALVALLSGRGAGGDKREPTGGPRAAVLAELETNVDRKARHKPGTAALQTSEPGRLDEASGEVGFILGGGSARQHGGEPRSGNEAHKAKNDGSSLHVDRFLCM